MRESTVIESRVRLGPLLHPRRPDFGAEPRLTPFRSPSLGLGETRRRLFPFLPTSYLVSIPFNSWTTIRMH